MTPGKRAGKTKHLVLFHSLHLEFYVKPMGNRNETKKLFFLHIWWEQNNNNTYIFNLKDYYFLTKTLFFKMCLLNRYLPTLVPPFFQKAEWYSRSVINIPSRSAWAQSYQVLLMCFQFPSVLLALPAEKRHQYYSAFRYNAACKRTRQLSHLIMTSHKQPLPRLCSSCP